MDKVILVGASKSLLTSKLGKIIDSYDVVCRINTSGSPNILIEYKENVGTKKDIWFLGTNVWHYARQNDNYKNIIITNKNFYNKWKPKIKELELCEKSVVSLAQSKTNATPTSGFLALFYVMSKYKDVTICGFDGFKGGHFYGNKFLKQQDVSDALAAKGRGAHNAIKEQEYIDHLIQNGKIKRIDE